MIKINDIKISINSNNLIEKIKKILKLDNASDIRYEIVKRSIDAREKNNIMYVYTVVVSVPNEDKILKRIKSEKISKVEPKSFVLPNPNKKPAKRPVIIGAGPCGLFTALELARAGLNPIIFERGSKVEDRKSDVEFFWKSGVLKPDSNVQFGEGGAGTFSDGKLNTLIKDNEGYGRHVMETFIAHGANEEILYDSKPHIGTDVLAGVIKGIREEIISLGGEFYFNTQVCDFEIENDAVTGVRTSDGRFFDCDTVVLAIGHSSRDTFEVLGRKNVLMQSKSFAVGFRVEHPQEMINISQYGESHDVLPAAPYKLTFNKEGLRSVYSFCMCPGGYVVNASSEEGRLTVNGMSYSKRDSANANSAIIIAVNPSDYPGNNPLSGVEFQRMLEKKAYELCDGKIPQQLFADFKQNVRSTDYGNFSSLTKGNTDFTNLNDIFTRDMNQSFITAMDFFGRKIKGFDRDDAIMSGIEARTSSPVRIVRNNLFMSNIKGLYPAGEGAGYAGGITSAAIDGIKIALAIIGGLNE